MFAVILPAAGTGSRFGGDKLLADLAGKSVLQRSVRLFTQRADVSHIVVVTSADRIETYSAHLGAEGERVAWVEGGAQRWQSVLNGLRYLAGVFAALPEDKRPGYVGVHDAARPLCLQGVIDRAFGAAVVHGGGLPCVPEPATLKRGSSGVGAEKMVVEMRQSCVIAGVADGLFCRTN